MHPTVLFVWGGWEGHEPRQCVDEIAPGIEAAGLEVQIADALGVFDDGEDLQHFRVIVPCWTMGELTPTREANLSAAVRNGVGLAGWHGGMGDAFRAATEFQFIVGGQFVAHPGGIIDYHVRIIDRDHPITDGLGDFAITSEQYYMHVDPSNRVLAATTVSGEHAPQAAGCTMPVTWIRRFGEGRVFYCSIGHTAADLHLAEVGEMIRRGILWAAGTLNAPEQRT